MCQRHRWYGAVLLVGFAVVTLLLLNPTVSEGVAVDSQGRASVADYGNQGNQVLDVQFTFLKKWGSPGGGDGQFQGPFGAAVDSQGQVYVTDYSNARVQVFDAQGNFLRKWGSAGSADGQFKEPRGVAVDSQGLVYVSDSGNYRIQVFGAQGNFLRKWGSSGTGDGQFGYAYGVAVDSQGLVYVADTYNNRIQVFGAQGNFLRKWGSSGTGDGQFQGLPGVTVDSQGLVYVIDYSNARVQVFDAQGNFLRKWGSPGGGDGQFQKPTDVAVDSGGKVYVVDNSNHRVQVFDSQGNLLTKWGGEGSAEGQFKLPRGVAMDSQGRVFVADNGNNRIQVFAGTPVMPFLEQPPNGSLLTGLGATLSWTLPVGTTQYHLQVTPANNDGPAIDLIRNVETSYAVRSPVFGQGNYVMLPGMTYSWRVRATSKSTFAPEGDPSWGPWSEWRTFRTPPPSSATIGLVYPANGSTLASVAPVALQWANTTTDIFYYEVQVSPDPNFGERGAVASVWHNLVHGGVGNLPNSWLTPDLLPSTMYYWRVRPRVQGDGTPVAWSATWSFKAP